MIVSGRGPAFLLAATLLALAGGAPSVASSAGDPVALTIDRAASHAIDTSDKKTVARAWRTRWQPNLTTRSGWTGSVRGCKAGKSSPKARAATLESINFARAMTGLDPVELDAKLSRVAQKAALIMAANKALSHSPQRDWKCWTKAGASAAGRSNLALSSGTLTAGGAVGLYLADPGATNTAAGHRRWILNPAADVFGSGLTQDEQCALRHRPRRRDVQRPGLGRLAQRWVVPRAAGAGWSLVVELGGRRCRLLPREGQCAPRVHAVEGQDPSGR